MPLRKWIKIYLLPPEHGGWFLLLGPFLLGTIAAGKPNGDLVLLLLLALAVYIARQPLVILTKAVAGRRAASDIRPALVGLTLAGVIAFVLLGILLLQGHSYLTWLGLPALPVLAWQLFLVSRREERQLGIELVGAGTLALAAPAAYWVSLGQMNVTGWLLWALAWLYAAASIVYVYLRLKQRRIKEIPSRAQQWQDARRTLLYIGGDIIITIGLAILQVVPPLTPLPFVLAMAHFMYGTTHPAIGVRPVRIGIEQSVATIVFYALLGIVFAFRAR